MAVVPFFFALRLGFRYVPDFGLFPFRSVPCWFVVLCRAVPCRNVGHGIGLETFRVRVSEGGGTGRNLHFVHSFLLGATGDRG